MMTNYHPLRQRIKEANSIPEIEALLAEGKAYEHATQKTIRNWFRTAKRRIQELNNLKST